MWGGNGVRPCRGAGWGQKLLGVRQAQGSIVQHGGQSHCSVITVTGKGPLKSYKILKIKKFKNLSKERETIHPPFDFLSKDWRMPVGEWRIGGLEDACSESGGQICFLRSWDSNANLLQKYSRGHAQK